MKRIFAYTALILLLAGDHLSAATITKHLTYNGKKLDIAGGAVLAQTTELPPPSWTWTALTGAGAQSWIAVAMSSDGSKMLAAAAIANIPQVFVSVNSGVTWSNTAVGTSGYAINCVAMSKNGQYMYAGVSQGLWRSADYGTTWAKATNMSMRAGLCCSYDGSIVYAFNTSTGAGWKSIDYGVTWTAPGFGYGQDPTGRRTMSCSADGSKVFRVDNSPSKRRLISNDGGVTWATNTSAIAGNYWSSGMSSNGAIGITSVYNVQTNLAVSTDSLSTWTGYGSNINYYIECNVSGDGGTMAACAITGNQNLYVSQNTGMTWTAQTAAGTSTWWDDVTINPDGTKILAAKHDGTYLWLGVYQ